MPLRPPVALLACLALGLTGLRAAPAAPADAQLNPRGRAILAYFQQLQASPDLRLVSGQFAGWSGHASMEELARIDRATGQWPAVIGLDYCAFSHVGATIAVGPPNALAEAYWRAGGLVELSWHAPDPANPKGGGLRDTGVPFGDLLTAGTPAHERWMKSLDEIATGLQQLQQAGVVVIWRPLHEMNGGWFWWGAQPPATFVAVWRQMFDYFTRTKKLHNLIWAFSPNHGERPVSGYYPGDAYVDLVGLDAYTDDVDPAHIQGSAGFDRINKPFGFTEFGPHGASNPPGNFDYRRLLDGMALHFPTARHFLCWDGKWNPASNRFAREFYNDPRVITRDRLPAGLAGPVPRPAAANPAATPTATP